MIVLSWIWPACFPMDIHQAETSLNEAENSLTSAYNAVSQADRAGANVTDLVDKLNIAAALLANAYGLSRSGNYDQAISYSTRSSQDASEVQTEAESRQSVAQNSQNERLFLSSAASGVGLSVLFFSGLFLWRFMKRTYRKRILQLRPETRATG